MGRVVYSKDHGQPALSALLLDLSFSTVFRVQHSYGRYVEARRHFQVYVCVCVCVCERERLRVSVV